MTTESALVIARMVGQIRAGKVMRLASTPRLLTDRLLRYIQGETVLPIVDATSIYEQHMAQDESYRPYEDFSMCPPWDDALVCYWNHRNGVTHVAHAMTVPFATLPEPDKVRVRWEADPGAGHHIEWEKVEWVTSIEVFVGGYSKRDQAEIVVGPCFAWCLAIEKSGRLQDIRWIDLMGENEELSIEGKEHLWDNVLMVFFTVTDFMNCINVELAEPLRHRHVRRQIARSLSSDRSISELRVRPITKTRQGETHSPTGFTMPLHVVRGHFAKYGTQYGRGKLFGKYEGRFWIQSHARGQIEAGVRDHKYIIETEEGCQ